jgi:hypothetical protein
MRFSWVGGEGLFVQSRSKDIEARPAVARKSGECISLHRLVAAVYPGTPKPAAGLLPRRALGCNSFRYPCHSFAPSQRLRPSP